MQKCSSCICISLIRRHGYGKQLEWPPMLVYFGLQSFNQIIHSWWHGCQCVFLLSKLKFPGHLLSIYALVYTHAWNKLTILNRFRLKIFLLCKQLCVTYEKTGNSWLLIKGKVHCSHLRDMFHYHLYPIPLRTSRWKYAANLISNEALHLSATSHFSPTMVSSFLNIFNMDKLF